MVRMNQAWLIGLCGVLLGAAGCGKPVAEPERVAPAREAKPLPVISGEAALAEVRTFVELGPKDAGTPGAERAAAYLHQRLRELGVEAEIQEFHDPSPLGEAVTFRNVLGRIPGDSGQILLLGSHYDTKTGIAGFEGANDSGSSTGLLLELARALQATGPHPLEIRLAFFDGEECRVEYSPTDGFHGSRHLAATMAADGSLSNTVAMILLDMIGDRDLTVTIPRNTQPWLATLAFESAHAEGVRKYFQLYPYPIGDDHEAFLARGVPAIDLIDFQFGSAPGKNNYWHTAADSMDKVSAESLDAVGRTVLRMLDGIARREPATEK